MARRYRNLLFARTSFTASPEFSSENSAHDPGPDLIDIDSRKTTLKRAEKEKARQEKGGISRPSKRERAERHPPPLLTENHNMDPSRGVTPPEHI